MSYSNLEIGLSHPTGHEIVYAAGELRFMTVIETSSLSIVAFTSLGQAPAQYWCTLGFCLPIVGFADSTKGHMLSKISSGFNLTFQFNNPCMNIDQYEAWLIKRCLLHA